MEKGEEDMRSAIGLTLGCLTLFAGSAAAHFNMILPQTASAKKGETVAFTYQWGHPFEHQLFDAPQPLSLIVLAPDGKKTELTGKLAKTTRKAGSKDAKAYEFRFTPEQRGDYVFVLRTPPIWMPEDGEFLQDTVKVVLHVQAQKGWDAADREDFEFVPLTRPYGLRSGMVFQAQIRAGVVVRAVDPSRAGGDYKLQNPVKPLAGSLVEVERYNAAPPKELPPDEHITRTVKTDANGVVTTTLTEPGWWCLTTARSAGERKKDGKTYPLRQRSTLWVFVDEPVRDK
jgi:cobalt/nickel transport protein